MLYSNRATNKEKSLVGNPIPSDWFNTDWKSRIPIVINPNQIPSTQTNFPLLVNSTFPELIGKSKNEIRFAGVDKVELKYDIPKFDSTTGELISWSKKPSINDYNVTYLYCDNQTAIDKQDSNAVWSNNVLSHYLNKFESGAGAIKDQTVNGINGTALNMDGTSEVSGKIDTALNFNDGSDHIELDISSVLNNLSNNYIISCWVKQSGSRFGVDRVFGNRLQHGFALTSLESSHMSFTTLGVKDYTQTIPVVTFNIFHHIVVYLDSNNDANFYLDGVFQGKQTHAVLPKAGLDEYHIGAIGNSVGDPFEFLNGAVEMLEVIDVIPSSVADFTKTKYNNQNDPSAFYSIGAKETI